MTEEVKDLTQFILKGMLLSVPSELLDKGYYRYLQNIRVTEDGAIQSRPKINIVGSINSNSEIVNSIKTLFDKTTNKTVGVIGIGDEIRVGDYANLTISESDYSNKPKTFVAFRNEQAESSSLIIADENKMSEVTINKGTLLPEINTLGIDAPHYPPTYKIVQPDRKIIDNCDDATVWVKDGVISALAVQPRINTTLEYISFDEGVEGICSIVPATEIENIQEGTIIEVDGEETFVEQILSSALAQTTITGIEIISNIEIEITCTNISENIKVGTIVLINSSIYGKISTVLSSQTTNHSYRVIIADSSLISLAQTIEGVSTFRCYLSSSKSFGDIIAADYLELTVSGEGLGSIVKDGSFDFTRANHRNLHEDSIIYFAVKVESLVALDNFQIRLIIDSDTDNYYYYELSANDFVEAASQTTPDIAIRQRLLQIQQVANQTKPAQTKIFGGRIPDQTDFIPFIDSIGDEPLFTALGDNQFSIFKIPFDIFTRSGTDESRGFRDISKIKFSFKMNAVTTIGIDSIWIGGEAKTNSNDNFLPYNYVYRYEIEGQGHISNWSPPFRNGIRIDRNILELYPTISSDNRVDKIAWARFGGLLNSFRILGSTKNDGTPFRDEYSDTSVTDNDLAGRLGKDGSIVFDFYKPFPILDTNKKGRCKVVGTKLFVHSGDRLKSSYPRGTYIVVDGVLNYFYTNPEGGREVELENSMGLLEDVEYFIKTPLMVGQPLPIIAGIFGQGNSGLISFALGDGLNSGTLYWFDSNSISTASDRNKTEITTPSEPLINMVIYDDYAYVYTNYRSWWITPDYSIGELRFIARKNAGSKGLFARDAICVCSYGIFFQSEDGINVVKGTGIPSSITNNSLYNLFPHNGVSPQEIMLEDGTIIYPPDYSDTSHFRLFHVRGNVYWRYRDIQRKYYLLVFDIIRGCWTSRDTFPSDIIGVVYEDEQESDYDVLIGFDGKIGTFNPNGNYDNEIESLMLMPAKDFNEPTLLKNFQNLIVDSYLNNEKLNVDLLLDDEVINKEINAVIPTRRNIYYIDKDIEVVKIGIIYRWIISDTLKLFRERLSFIPLYNIIKDNSSEFTNAGFFGEKFWERLIIEADTFGEDKQLILETDDGDIYTFPQLRINHDGLQIRSYTFEPFIAHEVRIKSEDGVEWSRGEFRFIFDIEAELGTSFKTQFTNHDLVGKQHAKLIILAYAEAYDGLELIVNLDGNKISYDFPKTEEGEGQKRISLYLGPVKGQLFEYEIKSKSNRQFRFYKKHSMVYVKSENSGEGYVPKLIFGDISRETELKNV